MLRVNPQHSKEKLRVNPHHSKEYGRKGKGVPGLLLMNYHLILLHNPHAPFKAYVFIYSTNSVCTNGVLSRSLIALTGSYAVKHTELVTPTPWPEVKPNERMGNLMGVYSFECSLAGY